MNIGNAVEWIGQTLHGSYSLSSLSSRSFTVAEFLRDELSSDL